MKMNSCAPSPRGRVPLQTLSRIFSRSSSRILSRTALALGASVFSQAALAVNSLPGGPAVRQLDMHPAVTKIAEQQHALHYFMLVVCVAIFVAVFGVMFYSIFKHRKSLGHKPANFHESEIGRAHV